MIVWIILTSLFSACNPYRDNQKTANRTQASFTCIITQRWKHMARPLVDNILREFQLSETNRSYQAWPWMTCLTEREANLYAISLSPWLGRSEQCTENVCYNEAFIHTISKYNSLNFDCTSYAHKPNCENEITNLPWNTWLCCLRHYRVWSPPRWVTSFLNLWDGPSFANDHDLQYIVKHTGDMFKANVFISKE